MTTFYVATGLENIEEARELIERLKKRGWVPTYDWTLHGSLQSSPEQWRDVALAETAGAEQADILIALLPGGRGTHIELGIALASEYNCAKYLVATPQQLEQDGRTCIFYHHPCVQRVADIDSLFNQLKKDGWLS